MLGNMIGEVSGRITGVRNLPPSPLGEIRQEVSFEGQGRLLDVTLQDVGTAVFRTRADGVLVVDEATIVLSGEGGASASLTGLGLGVPTPGQPGANRYPGAYLLRTDAPCWAPAASVVLLTEFLLEGAETYTVKMWEWK